MWPVLFPQVLPTLCAHLASCPGIRVGPAGQRDSELAVLRAVPLATVPPGSSRASGYSGPSSHACLALTLAFEVIPLKRLKS